MNRHRLTVLALGSFFLPTVVLVACGDDDALVLAVASEAGADGNRPDTSTDVTDTGTGTEGGTSDSGMKDASDGSAPSDASDAGFDADSSIPVGEPDSGTVAVNFKLEIAEAICRRTARCCFGDPNLDGGTPVDGGTYQQQKCINTYLNSGYENSSPPATANVDRITYNKTAAEDCIAKIEAASCESTTLQQAAIRKACYDAIVGTQKPGEPCGNSPECQPGNFCNLTLDAGAGEGGACEQVRPAGASCGDWTSDSALAQHTCSYRYSGDPPRYCDFFDFQASAFRPREQWTCKPTVADNEKCANNEWCSSNLCSFPGRTCVTTTNFFTQTSCSNFNKP